MGFLYTGWSVSKRDGVLEYGLGGSKRNGVLVFGMGCSYTGCGVSILDGVLKNMTGY